MDRTIDLIQKFHALKGFTLQQAASIADAGEELLGKPGQVLFREGDSSDHLLFLLEGTLEIRTKGGYLAKVEALNLVGEMGTLHRAPRSATVVCTTPSRYLLVSKENFDRLLDSDKDMGFKFYRNLLGILASHLRANNMLVEFFQTMH